MLRRKMRNICADSGLGHHHSDGPDGTDIRAQAVADTLVAVHDHGFAAQHGQNIAFRADRGACGAADAIVRVDLRMLRKRAVRAKFSAFRSKAGLLMLLLLLPQLREQKEQDDGCGDEK